MPANDQFVLLRHETPPDYPRATHWDFMIELAGALRTWALSEAPIDGLDIEAEPLADHRLAYLDIEGEISGGRGRVTRCDRGTYRIARQSEAEWLLELFGERLQGEALLTRQAPRTPSPQGASPTDVDAQRWRFRFSSGRVAIGSEEVDGPAPGE